MKRYELQIEIENACLLDCIHCSSAKMRGGSPRSYPDEKIIKLLSLFQEPIHIYFTGGEPVLYKNLLPLCNQILSTKPSTEIGIYTTGNTFGMHPILKEFAIEMKSAGIQDCYFSLYSNVAHEQDEWTNINGSFDNTMTSVKNLLSVGITPKAHLVLTQINYSKINEIIHFCQELGMNEVRILKLTPSGNAKNNWDKIGIPLAEQNKLIEKLIQDRRNYGIKLSFSGYPNFSPCRSFPWSQKCQAGTNLLYIDLVGDIYPCACTKCYPGKYKIGNIADLHAISSYLELVAPKEYNDSCLNETIEA